MTNQKEINQWKIKKASFFAVTISVILCILKFYIYKTTDSCSLHASATDSLMDSGISLINLFAVYVLSFKNKKIAPFGFDKVAILITTFQCFVISFLAFEILHESFEKLLCQHHEIHNFQNIFFVAVISFLLSFTLVLYQRKVVKETNSLIVKADMIHYISDIYSNSFIFIGFIFMKLFNIMWIDAALGVMVSFYLIKSVIGLFKVSIYSLLDLNFQKEKEEICKIVKESGYEIKDENINVMFSGQIFQINIKVEPNFIDNVNALKEKITTALKLKDHKHSSSCNHDNESIGQNSNFKIKIELV
ncbi:cation diffusion facilitator family transporter [Alphaproteobacteria bacterium endosymbiont of Tiliacea citrago]|uniref:cation diffusion facilitator family transporter n=1 Tax=Alphaproteobacteria bacterium endosymbiont of Tiliacea citrago TaxID=3077944 RepID=UPI00313D0FD8